MMGNNIINQNKSGGNRLGWVSVLKHGLVLYALSLIAVWSKAYIQVGGFPVENVWQALALFVLPLAFLFVFGLFVLIYAAFKRFDYNACRQFLVRSWWAYLIFLFFKLVYGGPI